MTLSKRFLSSPWLAIAFTVVFALIAWGVVRALPEGGGAGPGLASEGAGTGPGMASEGAGGSPGHASEGSNAGPGHASEGSGAGPGAARADPIADPVIP